MTDLFQKEHARALCKYPPALWEFFHPQEMFRALELEMDELKTAMWAGDLNGEHGIVREAVHVQVIAQRIIDEMKRRSM